MSCAVLSVGEWNWLRVPSNLPSGYTVQRCHQPARYIGTFVVDVFGTRETYHLCIDHANESRWPADADSTPPPPYGQRPGLIQLRSLPKAVVESNLAHYELSELSR